MEFNEAMERLIELLPEDDEEAQEMVRLHAARGGDQGELIRQMLVERGLTIRQVQVDRLHRERLIEGLPTVDVRASNGDRFTKLVDNPALLDDLDCPGATAWVSMELKHVLGVVKAIPSELELATVEDLVELNGRPGVLIQDKHGNRPITRLLAWCVDPESAEIGRQVYWQGGFVYMVRPNTEEANTFLDQHRLSVSDIAVNEVFGPDQRQAILAMVASMSAALDADPDGGSNSRPVLLTGPPGFGKSHLLEACANAFLREVEGAKAYGLGAAEFGSEFVSVAQQRISAVVRTLNRRAEQGDPQFLFVEEIEALAQDRNTSSRYLDGGSSLKNLSTLLAAIESVHARLHPRVGIAFTTNVSRVLDEALTSRCHLLDISSYGPDEFLKTLELWVRKSSDWYACAWGAGLLQACRVALSVSIGEATVGKGPVPVKVASVLSGRLARKAHDKAKAQVQQERFLQQWRQRQLGEATGPLSTIGPAMLCTAIVSEALSQVGAWSLTTARRRLEGTEVCSRGRSEAIEAFEVFAFEDVRLLGDLDGRQRMARLGERTDDTIEDMAEHGVFGRLAS